MLSPSPQQQFGNKFHKEPSKVQILILKSNPLGPRTCKLPLVPAASLPADGIASCSRF